MRALIFVAVLALSGCINYAVNPTDGPMETDGSAESMPGCDDQVKRVEEQGGDANDVSC